MRRLFWALAVLAVLAALVLWIVQLPAVQDRLLRSVAEGLVSDQPDELFEPDALRVLLCGTGSPLPHATRAKACVAVFAGGRFWLVDVGPGSSNRMGLLRVDLSRVGGVLLTHFHSDHIGDLGEWDLNTWVAGRPGPLQVYGPPGVEEVVTGFEQAYAQDAGYRVAHHGPELVSPEKGRMEARPLPQAANGPAVVVEDGGLRITAFPVAHEPVQPAYGYRFDYGGRSVVVSGDTRKDPAMVRAAEGADVLVHEAQANHMVALIGEVAGGAGRANVAKIMSDIPSYHTSPVEAAEIANEAGVGLLAV